jgi:hypothetical protein
MTGTPLGPRDVRIDVLRGVALLIIFSDHILGNVVAGYTPVAFGLADMAEVFVFLSGYTCGISYGRRLRERGVFNCLQRAWNRAAQVFAAKLLITILSLVLLVSAEKFVTARFFGTVWSIDLVKRFPLETLLQLETCRLELHQYCVLALYIPLLLALPVVLMGLRAMPLHTIAASATIYALTQFFPDTMTLVPPWRGAMYFNPLAWQFLFYSAVALAMMKPEARSRLRPNWQAACVAMAALTLAVCAHSGLWRQYLSWSDKPNLGWLRLVHFAAAVIIAWWLVPSSATLTRIALMRPLAICGRYSLVGYCAAGCLGILGEAAFRAWSNSWSMQLIVNLAGWIGCLATTALYGAIAPSDRFVRFLRCEKGDSGLCFARVK